MGKIIMKRKELEQVAIFEALARKEITQKAAAESLGLSIRQVRAKAQRFKNEGIPGLAHKGRGKPSTRIWTAEIRERAMTIIKTELIDFGPTFAAEKLDILYGIKISRETLRKSMVKEGFWTTRKKMKIKRKQRERKRRLGIMIQLDGSRHKSFGSDLSYYTFLVFIDDATSRLLYLKLVPSESLESVMTATREYIEKYGRPVLIYVDHGAVFKVNLNNPENDKETQFERALKQLNIELIHAHSPQAKGRVERSHKTLQDRLVKEFKLASITSLEEANTFLSIYSDQHNQKFACEAAEPGDAHRSLDGYLLSDIFCLYEQRVIQNDYTILYKKRFFQLTERRSIRYRPKDIVLVRETFNGTITISIRGHAIDYNEILNRSIKTVQEKVYPEPKVRKPSSASIQWNRR